MCIRDRTNTFMNNFKSSKRPFSHITTIGVPFGNSFLYFCFKLSINCILYGYCIFVHSWYNVKSFWLLQNNWINDEYINELNDFISNIVSIVKTTFRPAPPPCNISINDRSTSLIALLFLPSPALCFLLLLLIARNISFLVNFPLLPVAWTSISWLSIRPRRKSISF